MQHSNESEFTREDVQMLRAFANDDGSDPNELACDVAECSERFASLANKIEKLLQR